ncbi:MAG: D-alanyl-D-alanine carboxypeptidase [Lachnospiraceae bacterium]|nr:D-alanyl-D-alanine carboxypeptidase [Lachnospiraceae bacterium]
MRIFKDLFRNIIIFVFVILFFAIVTFINNSFDKPYTQIRTTIPVSASNNDVNTLDISFDDTIVYKNDDSNSNLFDDCYYALLIDDTDKNVYVSKNIYKRMYPASMTKIMTAMIVLDKVNDKSISLDDVVTVEHYYDLTSEGVLPSELTPGCKITVKDLLYTLLIKSNNYYALILADYVAGSEESFCELMNQKAISLGATGTHFSNPHGLDDVDHYTTAYDMYLILKAAHDYEEIKAIDSFESYNYFYYNSSGTPIEMDIDPTNLFMTGDVLLPANYNIEVWKTGTTDGAGNCLAMFLTRDEKEYVLVASAGESRALLYDAIVAMLSMVK